MAFTAMKRKSDLPENQVAGTIVDYLRWRGWHVVRQQSGLFSRPGAKGRVRVGEVGASDWYAVRPLKGTGTSEFFYFETKATGKKPTPEQTAWIEQRKKSGIEVEWFDSFESFEEWYTER